jgi:hypothetical protein
MLDRRGLYTLLDLDAPGKKEIIIYCNDKTERLNYTCDFIFNHVLGVGYELTNDAKRFESADLFKINYSGKSFSDSVQIIPHFLLSETNVSETKPAPYVKNEIIYLYGNKDDSEYPYRFHFDLFSAVFYFISRYEEWQTFQVDVHSRFEAAESLLFKNKLHLVPVVDKWILEFKAHLEKFYSTIKFPVKKFKLISTIDIDNLFAFRSKGIIRTFGAVCKDILKLDFKNLNFRIKAVRGKVPDPFDIYKPIPEFCFDHSIPLFFFFLFRSGTRYDRTIDPSSEAYQPVFKSIRENHAVIGIHPSYDSSVNEQLLKKEINQFSLASGEQISFSRQHFLRFNIRTTPSWLLQNGILADFSMGFATQPGFRAGTSFPFYYYDFKTEKKSELLFVPFCAMDSAYIIYDNPNADKAMTSLVQLAEEVKKVGGVFITVFHERTFSNHLYKGFGTLYKNLHLKLKEL